MMHEFKGAERQPKEAKMFPDYLDHANYVKWLLTDQVFDLMAPITIARELLSQPDLQADPPLIAKLRLCNHGLTISLFKLHETNKVYSRLISTFPKEISTPFRSVANEIERRGICKFRNKYAAHIIDDDTKKPLSIQKGEELLANITGGTGKELLKFYDWISPESGEYSQEPCVMAAVVAMRDHCRTLSGPGRPRP